MDRSLPAPPRTWLVLVTSLLFALVTLPALADPPTRAARISFISGGASFSPAGSDEWVQAKLNRPMWIGDRVWSGDGRVELQIGGASLRLAPRTSLQVLNFDDRIAQFELTQGSVALRVRAIDRDDTIEIDTPSFAFVTHEEGDYRVDVERDHTAVSTRRGFADIYGRDVAYRIDRRERFAFYSPDLRDYDAGPLPPSDAFDRWNRERAQREDRSESSRYVAPELVGYVDLDSHGEWRTDATYGNVWVPRVTADWAPYRHGNWTWVDPWGWTWVDDAPWGYAPSHYGRWTQLGRTWAWVPGPRNVRPAYSPAMVAWVGGDNFSLTVASGPTRGVGWFPLAPGEVWRPSYDVSRDYFTRVNVANTVVNNTTVVNVYNTRNDVRVAGNEYRFRRAPAAVTAVPVDTFVQGRPVQLTRVQLAANATAQANVLPLPPANPVRQSLVGVAPRTQAKPPADAVQRTVVARTAPPAPLPSIDRRAELVREGAPVTREVLDRGAAQPGVPQRPATPSPAASGQPARAAAPAAPPSASAPPAPSRPNVHVVNADQAAPKPLPERGTHAGRNDDAKDRGRVSRADDDKGRGATEERGKGRAQQEGSPAQPPQATSPARSPQTAQPRQQLEGAPQPAQPGRPQIAAPPPGAAGSADAGRAAPPAAPPASAAPSPPGRGAVSPPAIAPTAPARESGQTGAPRASAPAAVPNRAEGPVAAQPRPSSQPSAAPPAAAPQANGRTAAPAPAKPATGEPSAPEPSRGRGAEQSGGRDANDAAGRRNGNDAARPGGSDNERRAQPASARQSPPGAAPAAASPTSGARPNRPESPSAAVQQGSARQPSDERRAAPPAPAPAQPAARAALPSQSAQPNGRPPAEDPAQKPENRSDRGKDSRTERENEKERENGRGKDQKDKN